MLAWFLLGFILFSFVRPAFVWWCLRADDLSSVRIRLPCPALFSLLG